MWCFRSFFQNHNVFCYACSHLSLLSCAKHFMFLFLSLWAWKHHEFVQCLHFKPLCVCMHECVTGWIFYVWVLFSLSILGEYIQKKYWIATHFPLKTEHIMFILFFKKYKYIIQSWISRTVAFHKAVLIWEWPFKS